MRSRRPGIVKNVVATVNPSQYPTTPLNNLRKLAPRDLLHTVTSSTRSAAPALVVPSSAGNPTCHVAFRNATPALLPSFFPLHSSLLRTPHLLDQIFGDMSSVLYLGVHFIIATWNAA